MLRKIVSGGQTGADRAALDVAMEFGLETGGWIPNGRQAEDGPISPRYRGLAETDSTDSSIRTTLNVRDSDATLIVSHGPLQGGSLLTHEEARRLGRSVLHINLSVMSQASATRRLSGWLRSVNPSVLNVAGSRASEDASIYGSVLELLRAALPRFREQSD